MKLREINIIKNKEDLDYVKININKSKYPSILYGVSITGSKVHDFLLEHGITINAAAVDKEYFCAQKTGTFKGKNLYSLENLVNDYKAVNLFVGLTVYYFINRLFVPVLWYVCKPC